MLAAARAALANGQVASVPCSGFHHAHWRENHGFCMFNGLMVTAMTLLAEGAVKKVGILDADMHFGDGTEDIILRLSERERIRHVTVGEEYRDEHRATDFLLALWDIVPQFSDCDPVTPCVYAPGSWSPPCLKRFIAVAGVIRSTSTTGKGSSST